MPAGLVGFNSGTITTSFSEGTVNGNSNNGGGLVGLNNNGTVENCYSQGDVNGNGRAGGLVGNNTGSFGGGAITNCYSSGNVLGNTAVGGLIGVNNAGVISSCFWDNETSGWTTSAGGTGKYTSEMKQQATFDPPWDFTNIWGIYETNSYPFLKPLFIPTPPSADVGITITDSQDLIMPGDTYNYSVEVTNAGPDNALDVQAVINLPWTVDYVSDNQTATLVDNNITWNIGLLNNGETVWLGIQVTENGTVGSTLLCNGTVTTTTSDPNTANNVTNETTTINRAPNAVDDNYNVDEDSGPNTLVVLANDVDPDGDPFTITAITQGAHGTVTIINASKNVTYEPDADYTGSDTFTYTIDDGNGGTDIGTVTIDVINNGQPAQLKNPWIVRAPKMIPINNIPI